MRRKNWLICMAVLMVLGILAFVLILETPVSLEDLKGARGRVEVEGFHITADLADGVQDRLCSCNGFVL